MTYDLSEYLCPISAGRHLLLGVDGTNAFEICSTIQDGKGYRRFLKNRHHETLWFDSQFVYRGLDVSGLPGEVYAQYSGERYGAAWTKRYMNVGDVFERVTDIRHFDANGKYLRTDPTVRSFLTVYKHYDELVIPEFNQVVRDVLELRGSWDKEGKNIFEYYFYARGLGLVRFDYPLEPQFHSRFGGMTGEQNAYEPLPNFNEPTPPPVVGVVVTPPPPDPIPTTPAGEGIRAACNAPNGVYLRPVGCGDPIGRIVYGEEVTVWEQPTSKCTIGGTTYTMIPVRTKQGIQGIAAQKVPINDVWSETFIPAKLSGGFTLKAPFRRYTITSRFNDYRDYSKIAPTKKQAHEGIDFVDDNAKSYKTDPIVHVGSPGIVSKVDYDPKGYGNYIEVNHGNGFITVYGHLAEIYVRSGQKLDDWQIIGLMGWSGNVIPAGAAGAHLHLTVSNPSIGLSGYVYPAVIDPELYLVAV